MSSRKAFTVPVLRSPQEVGAEMFPQGGQPAGREVKAEVSPTG